MFCNCGLVLSFFFAASFELCVFCFAPLSQTEAETGAAMGAFFLSVRFPPLSFLTRNATHSLSPRSRERERELYVHTMYHVPCTMYHVPCTMYQCNAMCPVRIGLAPSAIQYVQMNYVLSLKNCSSYLYTYCTFELKCFRGGK